MAAVLNFMNSLKKEEEKKATMQTHMRLLISTVLRLVRQARVFIPSSEIQPRLRYYGRYFCWTKILLNLSSFQSIKIPTLVLFK